MEQPFLYLDNAATTRPDPAVVAAMLPFMAEQIGNPASQHTAGIEAAKAVERARLSVARKLGAEPEEIVFTSGGTEANNTALKGVAFGNAERGRHIIVSRIEHPSILDVCLWLEKQGFRITRVPVDADGVVAVAAVAEAMTAETILVSIMHGNNEIGTIAPLRELSALCAERGVLLHTDACQSFTRAALDVGKIPIDLVSINAHKIHGPKGVGGLFVRRGTPLVPLLHGGGQENGLRSGTHNVPAIVGFGVAVDMACAADVAHMTQQRDRLIDGVQAAVPDALLNGPRENRLCHNVNLAFPGVSAKALVRDLDARGIAISTGSACTSRSVKPSHVLLGTGRPAREALGAVRLSLSKWTTSEDIDRAVDALRAAVETLRDPVA